LIDIVADKKIMAQHETNVNIRSLRDILIFGLKGMAAYAHHAYLLGKKDDEVNMFFFKALSAVVDPNMREAQLYDMIMDFGRVNLRCMEILDEANTGAYGDPEPTHVNVNIKKGPFIIVSGHDLKDLKELLVQTEGMGINIYTHGELLPAHAYPGLKMHRHLTGNYGGAWQDQRKEFDSIPGCVLMTTNCIQKPKDSYSDRIYTTGLVGWPGIKHIVEADGRKDYSGIIKKALELGGFYEDEEGKNILVGFGHNAVLTRADKIIEAVKEKRIRHFFLIGGCDGARPGRNYYTEFAEKTPKDTVILTLACGKFRFNKLDLGYIGELPRLLDIGQCNDAYSAVKIAMALSEAFETEINELPLSLILSWYEQKAVCILLTLLSLGIKRIYLGPTLPAFISPEILELLIDRFELKLISDPESDLKQILGSD
jgi:hydroxylamine reductase